MQPLRLQTKHLTIQDEIICKRIRPEVELFLYSFPKILGKKFKCITAAQTVN